MSYQPGQQDIIVEDDSDAIEYSFGQWTSLTNPSVYHGRTQHITWNASASVVFGFTGAYVWYFGDSNNDHGRFAVSIDGGAQQELSSFNETYKPATQALFGKALDAGSHTITVTNLDSGKGVGLDYFAYRPLSPNLQSQLVRVNATDVGVSYSPRDQWTHSRVSYLYTYSGGASISFAFEGSSISYISDKNNDHGRFQVTLDNGSASTFSSYCATYQDVQVLYMASVPPGRHIITITNMDEGKALGLDHFFVDPILSVPTDSQSQPTLASSSHSSSQGPTSSTVEGISSTTSATPLSPTQPESSVSPAYPLPSHSTLHVTTALVVGVSLASIALLLLLLGAIVLVTRRSRWARPSEVIRPYRWQVTPPVSLSEDTLPSYSQSQSQVNVSVSDRGLLSRIIMSPPIVTRLKS